MRGISFRGERAVITFTNGADAVDINRDAGASRSEIPDGKGSSLVAGVEGGSSPCGNMSGLPVCCEYNVN